MSITGSNIDCRADKFPDGIIIVGLDEKQSMSFEKKYILAMDQSTTASRAIIFNREGKIVTRFSREILQIYPRPGWVEHDPVEIWASQSAVATEAVATTGIDTHEIGALGITNQRETTIIWDRITSEPVYNAIGWQDRRMADYCENVKKTRRVMTDLLLHKTGLTIDSYFSAPKIKWILDNVPGVRKRAQNGELCFGTVDSWLVWKLTRGQVHITDVTNASRTMLFNINTMQWDPELLKFFDIPASMLPEVKESNGVFCETATMLFAARIPVAAISGDQQAAMFGQRIIREGSVKITYGTGCSVMMNTGAEIPRSKNNLMSTVAWTLQGRTTYALEGSVFVGGGAVKWLKDGIRLLHIEAESELLAASLDDNEDVYFIPALTGLGTPHWDHYARGMIIGITHNTTAAHLARAAIESMAFQVEDVLDALAIDTGIFFDEIYADGGAAANNLLLQFQADLSRKKIIRTMANESSALGVALLAGLAVGFWKDPDDFNSMRVPDRIFRPEANENEMNRKMDRWHTALTKVRGWALEQ